MNKVINRMGTLLNKGRSSCRLRIDNSHSAATKRVRSQKKKKAYRTMFSLVQHLAEPSLLTLLLFFPFFLLVKRVFSKRTRLPPSPFKLPFIGNLHQLGSLPHHSLGDLSKKHGPLMLLHLGQVPTLVVSSAEMAREIMRTHDHIFASRPSLKAAKVLLYECMDLAFSPYGEYWRRLRKLCTLHLLSAKRVHSFELVREEEVASMLLKISRAVMSTGMVDMSEVLNFFSNDVLCRVVSGKFLRGEGRNELFRELIENNSSLLGRFHVEDYFPFLAWMDAFLGFSTKARRNFERWDGLLDEVIKDHGDRLKEEGHENDFVDVLLSLQKDPNMEFAIKEDHMKALLVDMFAAGTETSYATLEWAMAELVRNSAVMKKLQDELRGIASGEGMVREKDLNKMVYLKAVLKEVLRLHPPTPLLLPREAMEDCQIQGYDIPKKTRVIINYWAISRDPKFWEAPEEFHPERFLDSPIDFKGNYFHFIPFGAGRRICPGLHFATSTVELALANLVHQFDWELPHGLTGEELDMAEAQGLTIRKKKRLHLVATPYFHQDSTQY